MENAIWNGITIIASDISRDYEKEKQVRKASGHKELFCPDPDCQHPILRYCHGEIKAAFFAHLDNCKCDYADFDRENTSLMREVKLKIYESFQSRGYRVQMDVKLIDRHYTHLLITLPDNSQIAIELGTQRMTANRMDYLASEYKKKGINIKWLVISNAQDPVKESETFFMKRYQLNESTKKDVLILNWDGTELVQHIEDIKEYKYNGCSISSENYPDVYSENGSLESLDIENGELTLKGFHERFQLWLSKKEKAFQQKILELEQEEKESQKRAEIMRTQWEKEKAEREAQLQRQIELDKKAEEEHQQRVEYSQKISQGIIPESILSRIDQQNEQVRDKYGRRWVKCETCGKIALDSEFSSYGGFNHINLGICNACSHQKR